MPGGVLPYQKDYIGKELIGYMKSFDFRVGTLEAAIGTGLPYDEVKMRNRCNIVYARNEDFHRIVDLGFDVVSLANNHVFDLGIEGLKNTINLLKSNGIAYCGAGMNIEEASKPAILHHNGKSVAILAYCMYGNKYLGYVELATDNKPGVNPLECSKVIEDIRRYKNLYDYVVIMPHWGQEYTYYPMPECIQMAYAMIDAGADLVVGSHTHCVQPVLKYKKKTICFSLGNFMFPDFYMYPPRPIWYPDNTVDLNSIPDVVGYPFPIDKPIRQVWNDVSRIGKVLDVHISDSGVDVSSLFIRNSTNNIIDFYRDCQQMTRRMTVYRLAIKNPIIKKLLSLYRFIRYKR